mmetsp:Transcript_13590/g.15372  ORF Transcript_13590/g.15372 Transcript_13590/m.15372 type:complete len:156 (+) Transcript_13590:188-655(+)
MKFSICCLGAVLAPILAPVIAMAGGMPEYSISNSVTCESGYSPITSSWQDCKAAAEALGFTSDTVAHVNSIPPNPETVAVHPQGCWKSGENPANHPIRVYFNTLARGDGGFNDEIICSIVSEASSVRERGRKLGGTNAPTAGPSEGPSERFFSSK